MKNKKNSISVILTVCCIFFGKKENFNEEVWSQSRVYLLTLLVCIICKFIQPSPSYQAGTIQQDIPSSWI